MNVMAVKWTFTQLTKPRCLFIIYIFIYIANLITNIDNDPTVFECYMGGPMDIKTTFKNFIRLYQNVSLIQRYFII